MPILPEVMTAVCRLPIDFSSGNVSAIELVRRSGYLARRGEVTVERLYDCLAEQPALVDAWILWSEDNRSGPTWYIDTLGPHEFEVGYWDDGRRSQERFDDKVRACAEFVRHDLEQLADTAELWSVSGLMAHVRRRLRARLGRR